MCCRDKHLFVATKHVICRDKSMLAAKKRLPLQKIFFFFFCRDKCFVATSVLLSRQKTCFMSVAMKPLSQQNDVCSGGELSLTGTADGLGCVCRQKA